MPDSEQTASDWGGPYVQIAAFCEKVLNEADGVFSAVRLIDRFTVPMLVPPDSNRPPAPVQATLFICLKSGKARGRKQLTIDVVQPSGLKGVHIETDLFLEGEDRGSAIVVPMGMSPDEEGLYWFDIRLDNQLLTRMPLRLVYQTVREMPSQPPTD